MMLSCPICEHEIEYGDAAPDHPGLLGALGVMPGGLTPAEAERLEVQMREHLEGHAVEDWVTAFAQADVYIARLEGELAEANEKLAAVDKMRRMPAPTGPTAVFDPARTGYEHSTMANPPRELAAVPRRIDPDQTLIPVIPADQRPAGQVGRKTL